MNGAQDLGGMMGFGPIAPEQNEPVFHADWERAACALTLLLSGCGQWNLDMTRHARETLPPAAYLSKSYYDIWISAVEKLLVAKGMLTAEELRTGTSDGPGKTGPRRLSPPDIARILASGTPYTRPSDTTARFAPGDLIRTRVMNPSTHTRLPRYARGKVGRVEAVRGCHVFPDSNAHGKGEDPQWCYTVLFAGTDLWGEDSDPTLTVSIDAWEPYLEFA